MFIAIGGGSMREMTEVNDLIVKQLEHIRINEGRKPKIMFLPQASFESKPYVNSFTREFRTRLKCKTTCGLWKNGEMDKAHLEEKFNSVDAVYIGGGRYDILLSEFLKMSVDKMLIDFYKRGGLVIGNSAGAMIMFESTISDYKIMSGESDTYEILEGYGLIKGCFCPHINEIDRQKYISENKDKITKDLVLLKENEYIIYE